MDINKINRKKLETKGVKISIIFSIKGKCNISVFNISSAAHFRLLRASNDPSQRLSRTSVHNFGKFTVE